MDVLLLVVDGCPNEGVAAALLRRALDDVGLSGTAYEVEVVDQRERAEALGFVGSPTFLVDGRDPYPEPGRMPAVACRLYRTPAGLSGIPDIEPLRHALMRAADRSGAAS